MRKWIFSILLFLFPFISTAFSAVDWSKTSLRDINAIHEILKRDTVAAIDPDDSTFRKWLESGYRQSQKMALSVKTVAGFAAVDQFYVNGFHDFHVAIVSRPWPPNMRYPGFLIQHIGSQYVVSSVGHALTNLPIKSRLLSCDSRTPSELMLSTVLTYFGNPALKSSWFDQAPRLLTSWSNPFVNRIDRCVFMVNGERFQLSLNWVKPNQRTLSEWLKVAAYPYQPKFGVIDLPDNGVWINFPRFKPRRKHPLDLLQMKKITAGFSQYRKKHYVVVDVRGNKGGNSHWADVMLQRLYGKPYFVWAFRFKPPFRTQFRLSALTIKTFEKHLRNYQHQFGLMSRKTRALKKFVDRMKVAYAKGDQLFPKLQKRRYLPPAKRPNPLFKGKFYIVMDGRCNSACLTFIYEAKRFPNVYLLGKVSGADTLYTESTAVKLPSNLVLSLSISKSIGRDRGPNEPYLPDHVYPGDINDTPKLMAWVQKLAEKSP